MDCNKKGDDEMSCWSKEQLEQMLEDVVNELDLSEYAINKHGPTGTPPSELVKLVLSEKDNEIRILKHNLSMGVLMHKNDITWLGLLGSFLLGVWISGMFFIFWP